MKDFFDMEKLRALPAAARAQIAFGTAATVAGVIAIVWVTTLGARFSDAPDIAEVLEEKPQPAAVAEAEPAGKSWSDFTGAVRAHVGTVIEAFKSVRIELEDEGAHLESNGEPELTVPSHVKEVMTVEEAPATSTEETQLPPQYEAEPIPEHTTRDGVSRMKNSQ